MGKHSGDQSSDMVSLLNDLDHYHHTYLQAFLPNSGDEVIREWLRKNFSRQVVEKLAANFSLESDLHILGIGTGEGTPDLIMLEKLLKRFRHIHATVVEPGNIIEKFQVKVERHPDFTPVTFDWHRKTFDAYRQTVNGDTKFDFISLIQSIYYVDDLEEALHFLLSQLKEGGILLIEVNSDHNKFDEFHCKQVWADMENPPVLTKHVVDAISHTGYPVISFPLASSINVTSIFDELSQEGSKLLDFLTEICDFRQAVKPETLIDTLTWLKSLTVKNDNGNYTLCDDSEFLLVFK